MNRTKRYLRGKGYKFDCDYPWLPYEDGQLTLEGAYLEFTKQKVFYIKVFTSITMVYELERTGLCRLVESREWKPIWEADVEPEEDDEWDDEWDDEYTPSATHGDYSPSCPWNAPGMSISDFI